MGDFAFERPYLAGKAGFTLSPEAQADMKRKGITKEEKEAYANMKLQSVEVSFDNGTTFQKVKRLTGKGAWKFRIENEDMAQGMYYLVVRATMKDGTHAVTRTIIQIDQTPPVVRLFTPREGGRYNESMRFIGLSSDNIAVDDLEIALRSGDKNSYGVPGFIQGLYIDTQFWGATLWSIGAGLTFFDDNVKVQGQFGQFTPEVYDSFATLFYGVEDGKIVHQRFGGNIFGIKLLANIAYIPFRYYFGPDWQWLSANVALGANFSYFSQTSAGRAQFLSALLGQLEFPRVTLSSKQKMFKTFAFYSEFQLWFISSDVQGASKDNEISPVLPTFSFGVRANVF
jgi:hypothetical protein